MDNNVVRLFREHKIKAKSVFNVSPISFDTAFDFIRQYHYLGNIKPFGCRQWALRYGSEVVGVSMFGSPQGTLSIRGWFGKNESGIYELVRLAMLPTLNGTNATSFLLSASMRELKKIGGRAVITLADSRRHVGSIYQVCNFKYYGTTSKKSDFYEYPSGNKHIRGTTKDKHGVWVPRTIKHRYAYIMDNRLQVQYSQQEYPRKGDIAELNCCGGRGVVHDSRFDEYFTCPVCNRPMKLLNSDVPMVVEEED